jgi:murein L,D-transpeptidase YafK
MTILATLTWLTLVTAGPGTAQSPNDLSDREAVVRGRPVPMPVLAAGTDHPLLSVAPLRTAAASRQPVNETFLQAQLRHPRVLAARFETRFAMQQRFAERGMALGEAELLIRVFKRERTLELWARSPAAPSYVLVRTYPICAIDNEPGPKRRQGDGRTPEGFYQIGSFNPNSSYHLSLRIDYPNRSDRMLGRRAALGSDIYIHGDCVTQGCIAVTDDGIKEIYWAAVEVHAGGQRTIPVHIFPFRLTPAALETAGRVFADEPELLRFWHSLEPGYRHFETTKRLPEMRVDSRGYYMLATSLTALADNAQDEEPGQP